MSFSTRSYQPELLDNPEIPFADIRQNMKELDFINRWLGGHGITIRGLKQFIHPYPEVMHICEIGCGGGDNLRVLKQWCEKKKIPASFTGVDINPHCIAFAGSRPENKDITFICSDYRDIRFSQAPSVIFSSLFCHHFTDEEVQHILRWCYENATDGFFINDLHRHPLAYYSIRYLTAMFSSSYLVKNDAPLSVKRGFSKNEWKQYLGKAGITSYDLQWQWAFRWLLLHKKNPS